MKWYGLSAGIGGGCSVRPVEHANAYASLARGGVYKDLAYWLEVRNSSGEVIDQWKDSKGEQVVDPQSAYMTTSILADAPARTFVFGSMAYTPGFYSSRVWFAAKTGTTENGSGKAKDSWIMTYSPVVATAIWNGKHDGSVLYNDSHTVAFRTSAAYIERIHNEVYQADGKWKPGDKIEQPNGLQKMTVNGVTDIWPSWYNKKSSSGKTSGGKKTFDSVSKKLATTCTPNETRVEIDVSKMIDPVTKQEIFFANGYDTTHEDDIHQCGDTKPTINGDLTIEEGALIIDFQQGTHPLANYEVIINGSSAGSGNAVVGSNRINMDTSNIEAGSITIKLTDQVGYVTTKNY